MYASYLLACIFSTCSKCINIFNPHNNPIRIHGRRRGAALILPEEVEKQKKSWSHLVLRLMYREQVTQLRALSRGFY